MIWTGAFVLLLLLSIGVVNRVQCHVVLTFPPARYPPLDYLDSASTVGPCGIPKSEYLKFTTLVAGDTYNITWRMNYMTEGGFKLAIIDDKGVEVKVLTPSDAYNKFTGRQDPLQQYFNVALPEGFTCYGCALQLEREVKEWGNRKKFHSCSDVNIVKRFDDRAPIRFTQMDTAPTINNCMNHGTITGAGTCECDKLYSGNMCQYKDDCWFDGDCNVGGTCVDTKSQDYPRLVCYCAPGKFGTYCEHEFKPSVLDVAYPCFNYQYKRNQKWQQQVLQNATSQRPRNVRYDLFDAACYDKKVLDEEQDTIYWRKIGDELEVVLEVTGQSWIGLGWRPIGLGSDCKRFPVDTDRDVLAKTARTARALFEPREVIPQLVFLTLTHLARNVTKSNNYTGYYESRDVIYKRVPHSNETTESIGKINSDARTSGAAASSQQKTESILHPMDCTDIVMASALGDQSRFSDMYTRDRSTPLSDDLYYGEYSITAAYGFEFSDGKTVLMFRKELKAADVADHPLGPGFMHVIFAKGQRTVNYSRSQDFADVIYKPKKFMYHGHINRVALSLKFFD